MKPIGPRWEKIKQTSGDKQSDQAISGSAFEGGAKKVFFFGQGLNWVLKIMQPHLFDYLRRYNLSPGTKEWAQRVKVVVENHLDFINENFPGLFPRTRVFLGQAETKSGKQVYVANKLQEAISEDADPDAVGLDSYPNLIKIINSDQKLKEDFKILYLGMKKMKEIGLLLDIGVNRNYKVTRIKKNGQTYLKLFIIDSIPLYLVDPKLYEKYYEEMWGVGKDYTELITIAPRNNSYTYRDSNHFFAVLEDLFDSED